MFKSILAASTIAGAVLFAVSGENDAPGQAPAQPPAQASPGATVAAAPGERPRFEDLIELLEMRPISITVDANLYPELNNDADAWGRPANAVVWTQSFSSDLVITNAQVLSMPVLRQISKPFKPSIKLVFSAEPTGR